MSATRSVRKTAKLHAAFLSIVPTVERVARHQLRSIMNRDDRDDAVANVVALAWKWFSRLADRGKDARRFPAVLAYFACRGVKCGRRVWGSESATDAMSLRARLRRGFAVQQLEDRGNYDDPTWQEALTENRKSPIPDQASFRCDFPRWLRRLGRRNRRIVEKMLTGERTSVLSKRFGVSEGRISQLRREFETDWRQFHGEEQPLQQPVAAA